ncbi:hypothetical protein ACWF94_02600 [Streptomyces sp. NPDC055078]
MPQQENTDLKSEYADKVRADLDRNTAEQDRIRVEIGTLQSQLATLENDHEMLRNMSAALGDAAKKSGVPAPRQVKSSGGTARARKSPVKKSPVKKSAAEKSATDKTSAEKTAAPAAKAPAAKSPAAKAPAKKVTAKKPAAAKSAEKKGTAEKGPALSELIHDYLNTQAEPRTAREIAQALTDARPGRTISDNLVRTTTERLVARSRAERMKQGTTVYYTATKDATASTGAEPAGQPAVTAA